MGKPVHCGAVERLFSSQHGERSGGVSIGPKLGVDLAVFKQSWVTAKYNPVPGLMVSPLLESIKTDLLYT